MSYPGLVGYAHHSQAESEKLFDEIIFFVIERRAAEMTDRSRVIDRRAALFVHERALARFPNPIRHHVHRAIHRNLRPFFRAWCAIFHVCLAPIMRKQLITTCTFAARIALAARTLGIALDRNHFSVLLNNQLAATYSSLMTHP